eukprot:CAMPEP_0177658790 /NCGR_PEP_ID=MMETSP0447-20121125/17053_1 /TAXON_ID=0 /ORGANISM="Stygamoeba regulata, Strain BSH-02190019" /LENGTH=250 /DNA_ID=CAMNT_0019163529 /DNA_START=17 /DNA_END=765 /DNA_ORIENTATION=-
MSQERSPSPVGDAESVSESRESRSPAGSPTRRDSRSPARRRASPSPRRRDSRSPRRRASPSPRRRDSRSPVRSRRSRSPGARSEQTSANGITLYIAGVSFGATDSMLKRLFEGVGEVEQAEVVREPRSGKSRGFAFVTMRHQKDAEEAIEKFHRREWDGSLLSVEKARRQGPRPKTPGAYLGRAGRVDFPDSSRYGSRSRPSGRSSTPYDRDSGRDYDRRDRGYDRRDRDYERRDYDRRDYDRRDRDDRR